MKKEEDEAEKKEREREKVKVRKRVCSRANIAIKRRASNTSSPTSTS